MFPYRIQTKDLYLKAHQRKVCLDGFASVTLYPTLKAHETIK